MENLYKEENKKDSRIFSEENEGDFIQL